MADRIIVRNAADESQVKEVEGKVKRARLRELEDIRAILAMDSGRRFLWRLLERAKVFGSVWEPSARIHYNSGQQDFGHYVMAELVDADPSAFTKMMIEAEERKKHE